MKKIISVIKPGLRISVILALALLLSGCNLSIVQAPSPWFDQTTLSDSSAIEGSWVAPRKKIKMIIEKGEKHDLEITWVDRDEKFGFAGTLHSVNSRLFLQVSAVDSKKKKSLADLAWQPAYMLFEISGLPEKLHLDFPDAKIFAQHFSGRSLQGWPFEVFAIAPAQKKKELADFVINQAKTFSIRSRISFRKMRAEKLGQTAQNHEKQQTKPEMAEDTLADSLSRAGSEGFLRSLEFKTLEPVLQKTGFNEALTKIYKFAENENEAARKHIARNLRACARILGHLAYKFNLQAKGMNLAASYFEDPFNEFLLGEWLAFSDKEKQAESLHQKKQQQLEKLLKSLVSFPQSPEVGLFPSLKISFFPGGEPIAIYWQNEAGETLAWAHLDTSFADVRKSVWLQSDEQPYLISTSDKSQVWLQAGDFKISFFLEKLSAQGEDGALKMLEQMLDLKTLSKIRLQPEELSEK